jgi:hypothetical protein
MPETLHSHERKVANGSKQVVGVGMIDPLLSQALVSPIAMTANAAS